MADVWDLLGFVVVLVGLCSVMFFSMILELFKFACKPVAKSGSKSRLEGPVEHTLASSKLSKLV